MRYDWDLFLNSNSRVFIENLTHLCLVDQSRSTYIPTGSLINLTHLALPFRPNYEGAKESMRINLIDVVLKNATPKLKILVLHSLELPSSDDTLWDRNVLETIRIVNHLGYRGTKMRFLPLHKIERSRKRDIWSDIWENGARGGQDIWDMAEEVGRMANSKQLLQGDGSYHEMC